MVVILSFYIQIWGFPYSIIVDVSIWTIFQFSKSISCEFAVFYFERGKQLIYAMRLGILSVSLASAAVPPAEEQALRISIKITDFSKNVSIFIQIIDSGNLCTSVGITLPTDPCSDAAVVRSHVLMLLNTSIE